MASAADLKKALESEDNEDDAEQNAQKPTDPELLNKMVKLLQDAGSNGPSALKLKEVRVYHGSVVANTTEDGVIKPVAFVVPPGFLLCVVTSSCDVCGLVTNFLAKAEGTVESMKMLIDSESEAAMQTWLDAMALHGRA